MHTKIFLNAISVVKVICSLFVNLCLGSAQNEMLPASDRMPPHTKKKPSGPYDRQHLLDHLKTQADNSTIGDDYIPFVKKQTHVSYLNSKSFDVVVTCY